MDIIFVHVLAYFFFRNRNYAFNPATLAHANHYYFFRSFSLCLLFCLLICGCISPLTYEPDLRIHMYVRFLYFLLPSPPHMIIPRGRFCFLKLIFYKKEPLFSCPLDRTLLAMPNGQHMQQHTHSSYVHEVGSHMFSGLPHMI